MGHFSNSLDWHQNKSGRHANYSTPTSKITGGEGQRVTLRRKKLIGFKVIDLERDKWDWIRRTQREDEESER